MPVQPDTVYTQTQPWSSINTPTGVYRQSPDQVKKMAAAIYCARLDTPAPALRLYAPTDVVAIGLARQPTIGDVLSVPPVAAPQTSIFDYSGTAAGRMASTAPNIALGG